MRFRAAKVSASLLAVVLSLGLLASVGFAQAVNPTSPQLEPSTQATQPAAAPGQPNRTFTQPELDQMLAPIALYPDGLLSQVLMAATYPLEVVEAARWSRANPQLKGQDAVRAVETQAWDPSVKSMVAFPDLLAEMDEKLQWTESLGDAFLAQQTQVMATVQTLRQKAQATGSLQSNDKVQVTSDGGAVAVAPVNPEVVYVPYYDPYVVYGPWWWNGYPPVRWGIWGGYYGGPYGYWWGFGIPVGPVFFFGRFDWGHRWVYCGPPNYYYHGPPVWYHGPVGGAPLWVHDPWHRRGVPYPNAAVGQHFAAMGAPVYSRGGAYRGNAGFGTPPGGGSPRMTPNEGGARPGGGSPGGGSPGGGNVQRGGGGGSSPREGAPGGQSQGGHPQGEGRPHAFEGIGHGQEVRGYSARGHFSGGGHHR
jgi:Protein of unknown function (DUF3300)